MNVNDFTENGFLKLIDNLDQRGASQSNGVPFSPFRPYSGLHMNERAQVIRVGVRNGLRDLESIRRKYDEGGIVDNKNSRSISLQDYIAQRIQDTKDSAANVMRTREMPRIFYSNKKGNQRAQEINAEIAQLQQQLDSAKAGLQGAYGTSRQMLEANINALEGSIYNMSQEMYKAAAYGEGYIPVGSTCLYTLTDSFGKDRAVPGTQSFMANMKGTDTPLYKAKGFRRVNEDEELEPVDALIFYQKGVPHHAEMYEGASEKRQPRNNNQPVRTTYSNGQYTSEAMRVDKDYNWFDPQTDVALRFVGNAADSARWTNEYNELISNSEVADNNEFAKGGKIHIKPQNRGKFTALKERTGHSASWFKAHGTPAQRKMATFELNARKWKHGDGGYLLNMV